MQFTRNPGIRLAFRYEHVGVFLGVKNSYLKDLKNIIEAMFIY